MADIDKIRSDPDFIGLPDAEKIKVMNNFDPDFAGLPDGEKVKVVSALGGSGESFAGNVVESAKKYVGGIANVIRHPVEAAKGMGKLAAGTAQLLYPGEQEYEKYPKAFAEDFKEAYWGVENIKNTAYKDPVRLLGDVSTLLTGGGGLAARTPGIVGKVGKVAAKAGELSNPLTVAVSPLTAVKKGVQAAGLPEAMMSGAAKIPTGTWKLAKRNEIIGTMLKERITLREGGQGWKKVNNLLDELDNEVNSAIQTSSDAGGMVRIDAVKKAMEQVKDNPRFKTSFLKNRNIKEANDFIDEAFTNALELEYPNGVMPLAKAQELKKTTYAELNDYFKALNKPSSTGASAKVKGDVEATMMHKAAIELRNQIMSQVPKEVSNKLSREASLMTVKTALERTLNRSGNLDIVNFYDFLVAEVMTGGGMGVGAIPAVVLGRAARSPAVVSKMAVLLANKSRIMQAAAPATLGVRAIGGPENATTHYLYE